MVYNVYDKDLGNLEYDESLGRVINLIVESECSKYGIKVSTFQDFVAEFQDFQKDVPYFEKPVEVKKKGRRAIKQEEGELF